jgi:hypothetical protein
VSFLFFLATLGMTAGPTHAQQPVESDLVGLVAAQKASPTSTSAQRAVEDAVSSGLPSSLDSGLLPALPIDATTAPDGLGTLIIPKPYLVTQSTEPQHGQVFAKITYLYLPDVNGRQSQFCQVHYTLPDDAPLAGRIARLLALAHRTLVAKTGRPPVGGEEPFQVWLCRSGEAGGEQWGRNIYFYDLDLPRSSIEWIREIVHEYSHLALPPIGGYKAPEYWANGYLGERLIIRWFQRIPDGPAMVEHAWGDFSGAANFDRLLITPALALYQKAPSDPKWLSRTDADGMRYLIGQALTLDDKYGAHTLGDMLAMLPLNREARATDWSEAVALTLKQRKSAHRS